jgi:hypothetical protein
MTVQKWRAGALAIASLAMFSFPAVAQLAVSSNDNKPVLVNGVISVQASPGEDTVTIIDLGASPPKVLGEVKAPSSVGPRAGKHAYGSVDREV